jgi:HEAT repeat protein
MQDDDYWFVRLRVAQRLEKVKTKESRAVLQKLLKDENEDVRKAAKESLPKSSPG